MSKYTICPHFSKTEKFLSIFLALFLFFVCFLSSVSLAQVGAEDSSILYITRYQSNTDKGYVYGIFDLGLKPSIRILFPSHNGGTVKLKLHGKHYLAPATKSFAFSAAFEDVTGRVFEQSSIYTFDATKQKKDPVWFTDLQGVAGMYGSESIEIKVPPGTLVLNLMGNNLEQSVSPNQLLGYISDIQLFPAQ